MENNTPKRKRPIWEDISVVNENKEAGHFLSMPFEKAPEEGVYAKSPYVISLNGDWKFKWCMGDKHEEGIEKVSIDDSSWDTIKVPGVWQMAGYGQPFYYAMNYPQAIGVAKSKMPDISHQLQEIGVYRTKFEFPREDFGRRVFIHFGAVKAAMELYINGSYVGFSQGSMTPHEFDITDFVARETNLVTVVVYRYATGTYLEDQDMWFLSGIYRDVFVYSEDELCLRDAYVTAEPDLANGSGTVKISAKIKNWGEVRQARLSAKLSGHGKNITLGSVDFEAEGENEINIECKVDDIKLWSDETPNLYDVALKLEANRKTCVKTVRTGFRKVEIEGNVLKLNGKRILLRGVNRHDFTAENGWAVPEEIIRKDLTYMKQWNVNALRTSHYPDTPVLYDICDELGILVMDECDLETHGVRSKKVPGSDKRWTPHCLDRMSRMVLRDRNHPSIIIWSLGNEAGQGENFCRMKELANELDPTRPVHYEGYYNEGCTDFISRMYPTPQDTQMYADCVNPVQGLMGAVNALSGEDKALDVEYFKTMPVVFCEYAHCMENSLGNFKEHMDIFEANENIAGGFVWDYVDQAIHQKAEDGTDLWLHGEAFFEKKSKYGKRNVGSGGNGYFCANGVIAADRTPHPAAMELSYVYQRIDAKLCDGGIEIINKYHTKDLNEFDIEWDLHSESGSIECGKAEISCAPGKSAVLKLDLPEYKDINGVSLDLCFCNKEKTAWGEKGYVQAKVQLEMTAFVPAALKKSEGKVDIKKNSGELVVSAGNVEYRFEKGVLAGVKVKGEEMLKAPVVPNWFRPITDNDGAVINFVPQFAGFLAYYKHQKANEKQKCKSFKCKMIDNCAVIVSSWKAPGFGPCTMTHTINAEGKIEISLKANTGASEPLRVGFQTALAKDYAAVDYYGRGPVDNYCDRKRGSHIGRYTTTVKLLGHTYLRPQENAHRCDTSELILSNGKRSVRINASGEKKFEFNVLPHTINALDKARYRHELKDGEEVTLCIDAAMCGVGGDMPGMAMLQPQYKINKMTDYSVSVIIDFKN